MLSCARTRHPSVSRPTSRLVRCAIVRASSSTRAATQPPIARRVDVGRVDGDVSFPSRTRLSRASPRARPRASTPVTPRSARAKGFVATAGAHIHPSVRRRVHRRDATRARTGARTTRSRVRSFDTRVTHLHADARERLGKRPSARPRARVVAVARASACPTVWVFYRLALRRTPIRVYSACILFRIRFSSPIKEYVS